MIVLLLLLFSLQPASCEPVNFATQVHPILVARCAGCHNGPRGQAGLSVNTRTELLKGGGGGPAIVPGSPKDSLLIQRVSGVKMPQMPMGAAPLHREEIEILERWIEEGAKWDATLEKTSRRLPLELKKPPYESLDAVLATYFKKHGIEPPKPVSDAVFLRRAYLDLWGLLPTPEALRGFVAEPDRQKLVDALLANPENYAEHWISFWNDLLHNDEGVNYIGDRKSITGWLLRALKLNMPYDEFVAALMNPAKSGDPEGFLIGVNWRGDVNASQTPTMQAAQNSAQVFLGVNLKCNSCHDSFISSWKLKDAYGLASFFSTDKLELVRCDVKTGEMSKPKFLFPELGSVSEEASLSERRAAAAKLFTMRENGRLPRTFVNRVWRKLFGRAIVEPADDMDAEPWSEDLLDWLAADFVEHGYDVQYLLRTIMTSSAYRLPASDDKKMFRGPQFRRLDAEEFADAISSITGEWRVSPSPSGRAGTYSRDWRLKTVSLTRALGRPVRDLAVTERLNDPTTLQTLELVNGQTLATMLHLGAKRMLGEPERVPENIFDSGVIRGQKIPVDVDIEGASELHLVIVDYDSYDLARVVAGWGDPEFIGPDGSTKPPTTVLLKPRNSPAMPAVAAKLPSDQVYDLKGKHYTRFRAFVTVDEKSLTDDISPRVRAFVFTEAPNYRQLVKAQGITPVARPPMLNSPDALVRRIYEHALSREPSAAERRIALDLLRSGVGGLEDLLWIVVMSPEFQFVS